MRIELVDEMLEIDDVAEGLRLMSDLRSANRVLNRLLVQKQREEKQGDA